MCWRDGGHGSRDLKRIAASCCWVWLAAGDEDEAGGGFAFGFVEPCALWFGGCVFGVDVGGGFEGREGGEVGLGFAGSESVLGDAFDGVEGALEAVALGELEELVEGEAVEAGEGWEVGVGFEEVGHDGGVVGVGMAVGVVLLSDHGADCGHRCGGIKGDGERY